MILVILRWLKRLLVLGVFALLAVSGYEFYQVRAHGYPYELRLLDKHYRMLAVRLQGRTATHLHAIRSDNQRFFTYPIKDLHPIHQWRMQLYPIETGLNRANLSSGPSTHSEQTLQARDRLIERVQRLQTKLDASESATQQRSLEQEIERHRARIQQLENSLSRSDFDFKPYDHNEAPGGALLNKLAEIIDKIAKRADTPTE
jgi:hypothetical protein